jgi:hypothetical protein
MKKITILFTILAVCLIGCGKDDGVDVQNQQGNGQGGSGVPYTYNLKIEQGENAGFEMSGEVPNSDCIGLYTSESGNAEKTITFGIYHDELTMFGGIRTDSNGNVVRDVTENRDGWNITMLPINKSFLMKSGTVNVTNLNYVGFPQSGYAAFKLEFDGIFHQNIDENDIYKISGTITVNHPAL